MSTNDLTRSYEDVLAAISHGRVLYVEKGSRVRIEQKALGWLKPNKRTIDVLDGLDLIDFRPITSAVSELVLTDAGRTVLAAVSGNEEKTG